MGKTKAEIRATVRAGAGACMGFGGSPTLSERGERWLIEWEPGGCSDWRSRLTLDFVDGRVAKVQMNPRASYTGKYCL